VNDPKNQAGLGCPGDVALSRRVYDLLDMGSPRLALATAMGVPLAPYNIQIRATFADVSTSIVPDVGNQDQLYQDVLVDSLKITVVNRSTTSNQDEFQSQSDWFYSMQSGIEATLKVVGAPRYEVAPRYTPIATLADMIGAPRWPGGWVLTYGQELMMSFNATIALPTAPIEVICSFRSWSPITGEFSGVAMPVATALSRLVTDFGVVLPKGYKPPCQ
jgi:hypothetical protein